ncbi:hypothetical protein Mag101_04055 [Microbulbifer agarilyticus]|uniref:Methyltransferase domain-containing protein n=1 Tax=Microbulbifer agarilyticus TaxID=260552 RepID=A0A1Q2M3V6_9GAMM|nr:class I SAM-dependent methyltransferase [Microbulbifer agarilyticus]AQQ66902.1 hypothetical protein Mag101_04055 [Microbulbifer agarilyticus]
MSEAHWTEFWRQGFITTFGASLQNNYTGNLKSFWEQKFSAVNQDEYILDLATGNGAIPCIAHETLKKLNRSANIFGIDSAKINPTLNSTQGIEKAREDVTFLSNTPCEELPFSENEFHLISSQYGIEYSNWEKSLPEVFRVLKTGSTAHFVCHSSNSSLIKSTKDEIDIYAIALQELNIFELAIHFIRTRSNAEKSNVTVAKSLNDAVNRLRKMFPGQQLCQLIVSDLSNTLKLLGSKTTQEVEDLLAQRKSVYLSAFKRQKDMLNASLDDNKTATILNLATEIGFTHSVATEFKHSGSTIGVYISLTK